MRMPIPDEIIGLLEAHLEPRETVQAIKGLEKLVADIEKRHRERELRFVEDLKAWLSTELATKSEVLGLKMELLGEISALEGRLKEGMAGLKDQFRTETTGLREQFKEEIAGLKERIARLEGRLEATATKEDLAKEVARMDRKFTVMWLITLFAVVFLNQSALEFIARLLGLIK